MHRRQPRSFPIKSKYLSEQHSVPYIKHIHGSSKTRSSVTAEILRVGDHYTIQGH